jgi:hypothetical protein
MPSEVALCLGDPSLSRTDESCVLEKRPRRPIQVSEGVEGEEGGWEVADAIQPHSLHLGHRPSCQGEMTLRVGSCSLFLMFYIFVTVCTSELPLEKVKYQNFVYLGGQIRDAKIASAILFSS